MSIQLTTETNNTVRSGPERGPHAGENLSTVRIVTTSWDDGDPSDLRVANLLFERRLQGTFYIPIKGHHKFDPMNRAELQTIADQGFEIGAHGVSHPNLPDCTSTELAEEVELCKKRLEDQLHTEVRLFAYPRGRYNQDVISSLKQAGYAGARTTRMLARELKFDPYQMPTSIHVFPHTRFDYLRNTARAWYHERTIRSDFLANLAGNWVDLAKLMFQSVLRKGGVFHLYGHSWEIEEMGLWEPLAEVLDYVSRQPGVLYLSNADVLRFLPEATPLPAHHNGNGNGNEGNGK